MIFLNYKSKIVAASLIAGFMIVFAAQAVFAVPSSTNYNLRNYNFGWGGSANLSSSSSTASGTNTTTTTTNTETKTETKTNTIYPSVSPTIIYVNSLKATKPITNFVTKPLSGFVALLVKLGFVNIILGLLILLLIGLILGLCLGIYYEKHKKHHNIS